MVLVSLALFMKYFYPSTIETFREQFKLNSETEIDSETYRKSVKLTMSGYMFILYFVVLSVVPAIILAIKCNKKTLGKISTLLFAILFSDVYILWYVLRKYILNSRDYCPSSFLGTHGKHWCHADGKLSPTPRPYY